VIRILGAFFCSAKKPGYPLQQKTHAPAGKEITRGAAFRSAKRPHPAAPPATAPPGFFVPLLSLALLKIRIHADF
jgi:hypothetical protein